MPIKPTERLCLMAINYILSECATNPIQIDLMKTTTQVSNVPHKHVCKLHRSVLVLIENGRKLGHLEVAPRTARKILRRESDHITSAKHNSQSHVPQDLKIAEHEVRGLKLTCPEEDGDSQ